MLTDCVRLLLCLSVITVVRSLPYFQFPIADNAQLPDFEKQRRVAVFISDIFLGGGNCPPPPKKVTIPLQTATKLCVLNLFCWDNELQTYHRNFCFNGQ